MDRKSILEDAKLDMKKIINNLELDSLETTKQDILSYFDLLECLSQIKDFIMTTDIENESISTTKNEEPTRKNCYELKRNLRGGLLEEINLYVPEIIIRKQGFEEGDFISATYLGDEKYNFELVEKANEKKPTDRVQINYCILSKQGSYLVASEYWDEGEAKMIKCDDVPHSFLIDQESINKYNLTEGSLVDIAYLRTNIDVFKVIWKHSTDEVKHETPLPSSHYKTKQPKADIIKTNELEGKKVLLLGGEKRTSEFEKAIECIGGELVHAFGNVDTKRLESLVKSCDMLITMKLNINHPKARKAKEFAKKHGKLFREMDSRGISDLIQKAKSFVNS
ncbi:DUF2325 domain-containing protein [Bacillus paralicheniformis]|uniref:DUF2325 domain-containing protein n=1 Tax=Bacillus TaxID=1386 RepID=UPI0013EE7B63|nr:MULTISPECIES: DUF2325 domain-containing protein [Bacillus]QII26899.1 DUF2325 domain-containing protein [Bacillus altitudinis]QII51464.1 DUF2325 domain-containing protein [Bacillus paralicheniformis]